MEGFAVGADVFGYPWQWPWAETKWRWLASQHHTACVLGSPWPWRCVPVPNQFRRPRSPVVWHLDVCNPSRNATQPAKPCLPSTFPYHCNPLPLLYFRDTQIPRLDCRHQFLPTTYELTMGEESLSDVESDSEFDEMLFSETQRELSVLDSFTLTYRFWRANGFVQGLISKNRFDRLQRLMDVLALPGNCPKYNLLHMLRQVLWTAVIKGKDETVSCMFRHLRALRSTVLVHWISALEKIAVVLALAFDQRSSLDTLREVTFACHYQKLVEDLSGSLPGARLFRASLLDDLEEVKRILAADNKGIYTTEPFLPFSCDSMLDISAWGATARGHIDVLKELLAHQRKFGSVWSRKELLLNVVALASLTNNILMATEVINHDVAAGDVSEAFRVIFANICDDPAALVEAFSYAGRSLGNTSHHVNLRSRTVIDKRDPFFYRVQHGSAAPDTWPRRRSSWNAFTRRKLWSFSTNGLPCSVEDVLRARSLPILRQMLVAAPHSFVNKDECHYATVWNFEWFSGAWLLVGAGALSPFRRKDIPAKYAMQVHALPRGNVSDSNSRQPQASSFPKRGEAASSKGGEKKSSLQITLLSSNYARWSAKVPRACFELFIFIRTSITCRHVFPLPFFLSLVLHAHNVFWSLAKFSFVFKDGIILEDFRNVHPTGKRVSVVVGLGRPSKTSFIVKNGHWYCCMWSPGKPTI